MTGSAVIIGASGGIGGALEQALREEDAYRPVYGFARSRRGPDHIDLGDEATIAAAAHRVAGGPAPRLVIVASGLLHEGEHGPEKSWRDLDAAWLAKTYAANAIGPALVMKHFLPLLPAAGSPVFAVLGARIGSIADNRLGGWYGYRMAKAALAMLVKTAAIELKRRSDRAILVALHPGTVDTPLSRPFQGNVAPGQLFAPDRAAVQLLDVIDGLAPKDTGKHFAWDGAEIPA
jgi:NAD(P)-dependent dehydrogenase (short-subunit alcohol dehydrogenase family)